MKGEITGLSKVDLPDGNTQRFNLRLRNCGDAPRIIWSALPHFSSL